MTQDTNYDPLWRWVREREQIRLRKERGDPRPWTTDAILDQWRFCNVRREDDRVTRWVRERVREPYADHPHLWIMLCICRQINWPDTLAELIDRGAWPDQDDFDPAVMTSVLNERRERGDKVYTGAYVISAPARKGACKQAYVAERVVGDLWRRRAELVGSSRWEWMRRVHEWVAQSPGWGAFMSYQAVVDMRFTGLLGEARDRDTWAAAGPGTIRGLNRLRGRPTDCRISQETALVEMRAIYEHVESETGVRVDLSDIPNILCETDKYLRVRLGEGTPRTRYVAGRGS